MPTRRGLRVIFVASLGFLVWLALEATWMRRLLIRLVAVESMLVGWLAYWLFLVYANNPSANQGLVSQLGRFPQLSFTTVDISVLVIIASLSIFLAFKFQRGLRPGIRLERALQMLENLMKRNLVLEAQVAELKMEKAHIGPSAPPPALPEPKIGSWERAFRTPLEAGPPLPIPSSRSPNIAESSLEHESGQNRPTHRFDPKAAFQPGVPTRAKPSQGSGTDQPTGNFDLAPEKGPEKSMGRTAGPLTGSRHLTWEDSPKRVSESGVLNPSTVPKGPGGLVPVSVSKQPYIPIPVPKASPPSVIVGPGVSPAEPSASSQLRPPVRAGVGAQASPRSVSGQLGRPIQSLAGKPASPMVPIPVGFASPRPSLQPSTRVSESKPSDSDENETSREGREGEKKPESKPATRPAKKFPYEED